MVEHNGARDGATSKKKLSKQAKSRLNFEKDLNEGKPNGGGDDGYVNLTCESCAARLCAYAGAGVGYGGLEVKCPNPSCGHVMQIRRLWDFLSSGARP